MHLWHYVLSATELWNNSGFKSFSSWELLALLWPIPLSWHWNNHLTPQKRILAKMFLHWSTGFFFFSSSTLVIIAKILSTLMIKCLYLEISNREYSFLSSRRERRVKIFLLEDSDQNLNLRSQHFLREWVANPRSSHLNLDFWFRSPSSLETQVYTPHQYAQPSPSLVLFSPSQGNPTLLTTTLLLTHHLPTDVIRERDLVLNSTITWGNGPPPQPDGLGFCFIRSPCNISPWQKKADEAILLFTN